MTVETRDGNGKVEPRRRSLVRAMVLIPTDSDESAERALEFRDGASDGTLGTMTGHFAVFNRWTEIDSFFEGNFLERIAPGALKKTMRERRDEIKSLFQHGRDAQIGSKPLGPIERLEEDSVGGAYDVSLLDTSYNRDLVPGLKAGLYGASFRFEVIREDVNADPGASDFNPRGIEERTIKEMRLYEFGPVTFPAYAEATAGMRSLTDWYGEPRELFEQLSADPQKMRALIRALDDDGASERLQIERARALVQRLDPDGVSQLAQMIACGAEWAMEEQDPADVAKMEGVLATVADMLQQEIAEPPESNEGEASNEPEGSEREADDAERDDADNEDLPATPESDSTSSGAERDGAEDLRGFTWEDEADLRLPERDHEEVDMHLPS